MFLYRLPRSRTVMLILNPLRSIIDAIKYKGSISTNQFLRSILLNILLFIPLGMIISSLRNGTVIVPLFIGLGITIITEILQYLTKLGWAELDDVLNNCVGMAIGILLYKKSRHVFNKNIPQKTI